MLSMHCTLIGVFKETNKLCLQSLLEGKKGSALHSQIRLDIDSNLADKTLEGCLHDQYFSGLLVFTNLANEHHFREGPEYGQMLKIMWCGDLTKEDCKRINIRVLGTNGLELPSELESKHKFDVFQSGIY